MTTFDDIENAIYYEDSTQDKADYHGSLKVMTWNIRFGAARIPWFEDSCGDRVLMTESDVTANMDSIISFINTELPDILLVQEIDISSKRSAYMNQVQYILNNTYFNYGVYASMWDAEIIPSYGLGKVNVGNAILSRWKITDAERIKLPLRTDQEDLTQYFYLRRNILKAKIVLPIKEDFYVVDIHATAFATDDTKQKHIDKYKEVLDKLNDQGAIFVTGGDLNSIPSGADSTDFCIEDICSGESFHTDTDGGPHREGSYFNNFISEADLVQPFYDDYHPAIDLISTKDPIHFTHSPWITSSDSTGFIDIDFWDRKLDYLFTNILDGFSNGTTHQAAHQFSDHAPLSATLNFSN